MKSILFIPLFFSSTLFGQTKQNDLTFKLDQYFSALTDINNFNGNIIIEKENKIFLNKTYKIKGGNDSLKVNKDSKFIIASVAKLFIKFSIYKLAEQHKLNLDDNLSKFIPDFPNGDKITIEHLLYHKSGLPRVLTNYEKYDDLTFKKITELAKIEKLQFEPGKNILYSNIGFSILQYVINKSAREGYPKFTENLLKKVGLKNTKEFNKASNLKNFALGFDTEDGKIIPASQIEIKRFETGMYYSTISDMYDFSKKILSDKIINKKLLLKLFDVDSTLIQAGGIQGYRAYFYINLKTNVTFIFLCNFTDIPIQEMTADIVNILDNKPYEIPKRSNRIKINLPDTILHRYLGKFSLSADFNQTFTIIIENNQLFIIDKDGEKAEMLADTETTFFYDPKSKDGYVFQFNSLTKKYDLTIISTGLKLKTTRIE